MCGRFTLTADIRELVEAFGLDEFPGGVVPSYNIAPTQPVLAAVFSGGKRRAGRIRWGLVPFWVKYVKKWKPLINARSESLHERASFKHLVNKRRCIIFADSFYEWKAENGKKTPYRVLLKSEKPFAFAALWDRNTAGGEELTTCTIITTDANPKIKPIHERMPVILDGNAAVEMWLNMDQYPYHEARKVLRPLPEVQVKAYAVSDYVNSAKNNDSECIRPVGAEF